MKLKATIISLLSVLLIAMVGIGIYCAMPAIIGTIDGSRYYTAEELQQSYDQGYADGAKSETELLGQVQYYRDLVDEYYINVNTLNQEITLLTQNNAILKTLAHDNEQTINNLQTVINANDDKIASLNTEITALKKSIAYYEQYISTLETENQVVATFEFNGSVYNLQILTPNSLVSVVDPVSTEHVTFIGWTVNDELVDLTTYRITSNTKFVARVEYTYAVTFVSDDTIIATQAIHSGNCATIPTPPSKDGYTFIGWSVDSETVIDIENYLIMDDTVFTALWQESHATVTFIAKDTTIATQTVKHGEYATAPTITEDSFLGWTVDGANIINVATYPINSNTTFIAKYGTWVEVSSQLLISEDYDATTQSRTEYLYGVKAGDKIKAFAWGLTFDLDYMSEYYYINSADGNELDYLALDQIYIGSTPTTYTLGVLDYYSTPNYLTITLSCTRDNYLTIICQDTVGFYVKEAMLFDIYVLR